MSKLIRVKYVHSPIGRDISQKATVKGLGFTRLNQIREFTDTPAIRGMINKVVHLVQVLDS